MRRADRLFKIVNFIKSRRRAVTAQRIASEFEICERTVYRDIRDLMDSGVPIYGEAGVGYIMDHSYNLPALNFDIEEIEALVLGLSMVQSWTDNDFSKSARRAMEKIKIALPPSLKDSLDETALLSPPPDVREPITVNFSDIRRCIRRRQKINFMYADEHKRQTQRTVRPLGLAFFGPTWLLISWCELRKDFRNFRLDRMIECHAANIAFEDEPGKTLDDYMKTAECTK